MKSTRKEKANHLRNFIESEIGIVPSEHLIKLILNPSKLQQLRNDDLRNIVVEYVPIEKYMRGILDGTTEIHTISMFSLFLHCRIQRNEELETILREGEEKL